MRAEDRFGWLDDEAAEDLLRGNAVDGASPCPSTEAQELVRALEGLAVSHQPTECAKELPGEADALAAFRASRSNKRRGASFAPRSGRGRRMLRRGGTPLQAGLVMMLAGFALGGVAVAATNGVFPAPFGDGGAPPAPGASDVGSPGAEPHESEADAGGSPMGPGEDTRTGGPSLAADPDASDESESGDARDVAGAETGNGGEWGGDDDTLTDEPTTWPHEPTPDEDGRESTDPGNWPPIVDPTDPNTPDHTVVVALCKAYEGDRIEKRMRRQLERVAGGPDRVVRYCEKHGDSGGDGGGTEGGDGSGGSVGIPAIPGFPGIPGTPGNPGVPEGGEESESGGSGDSGGADGSGGSDGGAASGGGDSGGEPGSESTGGGDAGAPGASNGTDGEVDQHSVRAEPAH